MTKEKCLNCEAELEPMRNKNATFEQRYYTCGAQAGDWCEGPGKMNERKCSARHSPCRGYEVEGFCSAHISTRYDKPHFSCGTEIKDPTTKCVEIPDTECPDCPTINPEPGHECMKMEKVFRDRTDQALDRVISAFEGQSTGEPQPEGVEEDIAWEPCPVCLPEHSCPHMCATSAKRGGDVQKFFISCAWCHIAGPRKPSKEEAVNSWNGILQQTETKIRTLEAENKSLNDDGIKVSGALNRMTEKLEQSEVKMSELEKINGEIALDFVNDLERADKAEKSLVVANEHSERLGNNNKTLEHNCGVFEARVKDLEEIEVVMKTEYSRVQTDIDGLAKQLVAMREIVKLAAKALCRHCAAEVPLNITKLWHEKLSSPERQITTPCNAKQLHAILSLTPEFLENKVLVEKDPDGLYVNMPAEKFHTNEKLQDEISRLTEALEACLKVLPGLEVRSWPPGFELKYNAIAKAQAALEPGKGE